MSKKIWYILNIEERKAAIILLGYMLIGMGLETLGVGLVIPALALITKGSLVAKYPLLATLISNFSNFNRERLIVIGILVLVVMQITRLLFLAFLAWRQARFVYGLQVTVSQRLFAGYLRQPYAFHLQRNSAQLIHNTIGQVGEITYVVQQGLMAMTEFLVLIGISVLLLMVEPLGALFVGISFALLGWVFNRITRRHILRWGEARQQHEGQRLQHLQQGLGGVKDVKLLGREDDFLAQYLFHNTGSAQAGQRQNTLQALPRFWLELLAIIGLAAVVLVMVGRGKPLEMVVPTLGLFAAAAFRLMPSVNRVMGAIQTVRFCSPVIDTVYGELSLLAEKGEPRSDRPLFFEKALILEQVKFRYPDADVLALRGIDLSIPRGASVGFIGSSGAGKSTLVDILLGLLSPTSGTVKVDGIDIQTNLRGWQDQIGYVPQSIFLTDDTLRRNIAFGLSNHEIDESAVWHAIRAAQLDQFVNDLPKGLDTVVGERGVRLSGGQRQRIGIARALYHDPPVLVLDEATSSLDTSTERGVMESVRTLQGDKTLIVVAHRLSTVEHCGRLFRLEKGSVVEEGNTSEMLEKYVTDVR